VVRGIVGASASSSRTTPIASRSPLRLGGGTKSRTLLSSTIHMPPAPLLLASLITQRLLGIGGVVVVVDDDDDDDLDNKSSNRQ
jgi:hypothetical protein